MSGAQSTFRSPAGALEAARAAWAAEAAAQADPVKAATAPAPSDFRRPSEAYRPAPAAAAARTQPGPLALPDGRPVLTDEEREARDAEEARTEQLRREEHDRQYEAERAARIAAQQDRAAEALRLANEALAEIAARGAAAGMAPDPAGLRIFVVHVPKPNAWPHAQPGAAVSAPLWEQQRDGGALLRLAKDRFDRMGWATSLAAPFPWGGSEPTALVCIGLPGGDEEGWLHEVAEAFVPGSASDGFPLRWDSYQWSAEAGPVLASIHAAVSSGTDDWMLTPVADSKFHERLSDPDEDADTESRDYYAGVRSISVPVPERLRKAIADGVDLADAVRFPYSLREAAELVHDMGGGDGGVERAVASLETLGHGADTAAAAPCLVDGLIPKGELCLLAGGEQKGKTSLLLDLATAVASGQGSVFGFPISPECRGGFVVVLYTEDGLRNMRGRMAKLITERACGARIRFMRVETGGFADAMAILHGMPGLVGVFMDGLLSMMNAAGMTGENDNDKMGAFLDQLRSLAQAKDCAFLFSHHLGQQKHGDPTSSAEVYRQIRGAQAIKDRTRLVLTLYREGKNQMGAAVLGVWKSSNQDAIPRGEVRLAMDAATGIFARLGPFVPLDGVVRPEAGGKAAQISSEADAPADAAQATAAVVRLVAAGAAVFPTGTRELHVLAAARPADAAEVAGWSRARCRAAVEDALRLGLLVNDKGSGLRAA